MESKINPNESIKKIAAWAKKNPLLAAGIAGGVVLVIYLLSRSSSGTDETYTQGIPDETGADLSGLGGSAGAMPPVNESSGIFNPTPAAPTPSVAPQPDSGFGDVGSWITDPGIGSFVDMPFTAKEYDPTPYSSSTLSAPPAAAGSALGIAQGRQMITPLPALDNFAAQGRKMPTKKPEPKASTPQASLLQSGGAQAGKKMTSPKPQPQTKVKKVNTTTKNKPNPFAGSRVTSGSTSLTVYTGPRAGYVWNGFKYIPIPKSRNVAR